MALLLRTLRESGKKKIQQKLFIIPFLFTFLNAFFGLLSVVNTLDENYLLAAYCILLAVFMDFCDGKLARAFGSCSGMGTQLDSLCDAVSFCFAPAILLYGWRLHAAGSMVGFLAVAFYLCSGLFRLAKFNILSMNQKSYFVGLPTTWAAFFIATMILAYPWIAHSFLCGMVSCAGLIAILFLLSLLMLSSLHFFKSYTPKRAWIKIGMALLGLVAAVFAPVGHLLLFVSASAYILGNMVVDIYNR